MLLLSLLTTGCLPTERLIFKNPQSAAQHVVIEHPNDRGQLKIVYEDAAGPHHVVIVEREIMLNSAVVSWLPAENLFGLMTCGSPDLRVAYDTSAYTHVSFERVRESLNHKIRSTRGYPGTGDPIQWACSTEGIEQLRQQQDR